MNHEQATSEEFLDDCFNTSLLRYYKIGRGHCYESTMMSWNSFFVFK